MRDRTFYPLLAVIIAGALLLLFPLDCQGQEVQTAPAIVQPLIIQVPYIVQQDPQRLERERVLQFRRWFHANYRRHIFLPNRFVKRFRPLPY